MNDRIFIRLGLNVRGPYSISDLHELARRGNFSKAHEVSVDKTSWTAASNHPELFPSARRLSGNPGPSVAGAAHGTQPALADTIQPSLNSAHVSGLSTAVDDSVSDFVRPVGDDTIVRPFSQLALWTIIDGSVAFVLLLVCTAIVVMRLRAAPFVASANPLVLALLALDIVAGGIAVALGHYAIRQFRLVAGGLNERNLIVVGLSCGYSVLIMCVLFAIALLTSAFA